MPSTRTYAVVALALALPLLAWPLASPPPNPPDPLTHDAGHVAPADSFPVDDLDYRFEELSDHGQAVVEATIERPDGVREPYEVAPGEGVPEFDYGDDAGPYYVLYDGAVYRFHVGQSYVGPSGPAVVSRLASLLASFVLFGVAGYVWARN